MRAWGLVLYGTLPASLTVLGLVRVETLQIQPALIVPALVLVIVPVVLTYLLLRQRLLAWYILRYGLNLRTAVLTISIVLASCLVSSAAGLIKGRYQFLPPAEWLARSALLWSPIVESLLTGSVLLVGSTTLFLTAVKDSAGLPALPSSESVTKINTLRQKMGSILGAPVWHAPQRETAALKADIADAIRLGRELSLESRWPPLRRFYQELATDLTKLESARSRTDNLPGKWSDLFEPSDQVNQEERRVKESLERLRSLQGHA